MKQKTMHDSSTGGLMLATGFSFGFSYYLLNIPESSLAIETIRAFFLGGIGALGAWVVRRFIIKYVDQHGGFLKWVRSWFKK